MNRVRLSQLVEGMEFQTDESTSYLNRTTGEIVTIADDEFWAAEEDKPAEEHPEWQRDSIRVAKELLNADYFIELPSKFDIHEYSIMERFCLSLSDEALREEMYHSIKGSGAFRRFKENIHRHGIADEWYGYRDEAMKQIAIDWCEANGIDYVDD